MYWFDAGKRRMALLLQMKGMYDLTGMSYDLTIPD